MSAWIVVMAAIAASQQAGPMNVDQAISIAIENAASLQIVDSTVRKSGARIREAQGSFGPKVNVNGTYTRFDKATTANIGGGNSVVISPIDQKQIQGQFTWPIDIAGVNRATVKAGRLSQSADQLQRDVEVNTIKAQVKDAYYTVLKTQALIKVAEESLKIRTEALADVKVRFDAGVVAKFDVLQAETQVSQAKTDLIAARNAWDLSKQNLNNVLSRPAGTPVELVDISGLPAIGIDIDAAQQAAKYNRPEIKVLGQRILSFETLMKVARAGLAPSLALSIVQSNTLDAAGFSSRSSSATGVVTLSVPLYDSGLTRAKVDQAKEDTEQLKIQYGNTVRSVAIDAAQAVTRLKDAAARLEASTDTVRLASEALRIAKIRYSAGEAIQLEVNTAENDYIRAKASETTAKYDVWTAYSQVQRAVGVDALAGIIEKAKSEKTQEGDNK